MTQQRSTDECQHPAPRRPHRAAPDNESDEDRQDGYFDERAEERMRDTAMMHEKLGARPPRVSGEHFGDVGYVGGDGADDRGARHVTIRDRAAKRCADQSM